MLAAEEVMALLDLGSTIHAGMVWTVLICALSFDIRVYDFKHISIETCKGH